MHRPTSDTVSASYYHQNAKRLCPKAPPPYCGRFRQIDTPSPKRSRLLCLTFGWMQRVSCSQIGDYHENILGAVVVEGVAGKT